MTSLPHRAPKPSAKSGVKSGPAIVASAASPWLVADIGGTNARFGLIDDPGNPVCDIRVLACAEYSGLAEAVDAYLADVKAPRPKVACVAVAGPVGGDRFRLTNHSWDFSIEETRITLGLDHLALINDFTALAMALPFLSPADLIAVGGDPAVVEAMPGQALGVVGPGTGLGVGALLPVGGRWVPIPGEGGHVDAPAVEEREWEVIRVLKAEQGAVTAECLLSGGGLERLYRCLSVIDGTRAEPLPASLVTERGLIAPGTPGADPHAREALEMFCALLGSVAGNAAVTLGARGGMFLGGGILPRMPDMLLASRFRARFDNRLRMADYARRIPVHLIIAKTPALTGAAAWIQDRLTFGA